MIAVVLLMLFVCVALPVALGWRLWRLDECSLAGWLLVLAETVILVALIMLVGRWDMAGMWTGLGLVGWVAAAALVSLCRHARRPWRAAGGPPVWRARGATLVTLFLFGSALIYLVAGALRQESPHNFVFPLQGGHFVVAHGGGVGLLNHHRPHRVQRYAVDITAVGAAGFRADSLLPQDPARYAIFGKTVVSPCTGMVVAAVDGLPDLPAPTPDRANPAGNHVVLSCQGLQIELAHLKRGSVAVSPGDQITASASIGQVGNSGNSTEPHLHMHAFDARTGAGVQMSFGGVLPVRNMLFLR